MEREITKNERDVSIDIAKGIGIFLVIVGHLLDKNSFTRLLIYGCHMPLFFIVTGILTKNNMCKTSKYFLQETKLLSSYFWYSGIYIVFDILIRILILRKYSVQFIFWDVYQTIIFGGINVLWFIATLFWAKILSHILLDKLRNNISILVTSFLLYTISFAVMSSCDEPGGSILKLFYYLLLSINRIICACAFILLGYILKNVFQYIKNNIGNLVCIVFLIVSAMLYYIAIRGLYLHGVEFDMHLMRLSYYGLFYVLGIWGTGIILSISVVLERMNYNKILIYWGRNSLLLMVIHEYLMIRDILEKLLAHLFINNVYVEIILLMLIFSLVVRVIGGIDKRINKRVNNLVSIVLKKLLL